MLNPFAILALLSLPIVYLLHRYHRRPSLKMVSSLYLWTIEQPAQISGQAKEHFVQSLSFWLEILCCLLLFLLLLNPPACTGSGNHHVLILDTSASMQATEIQSEVQTSLDNRGQYDRYTIITTGTNPSIASDYVPAHQALSLVSNLSFQHASSSLQEAIHLAQSIGLGKIEVWTDQQQSLPSTEIEWHTLKHQGHNIGFVRGEWNDNQISLQLLNTFKTQQMVSIAVNQQVSDTDVETRTLDAILDANDTTPLSIEMAPHVMSVTMELQTRNDKPFQDALHLDDRLDLIPVKPLPLRIASDIDTRLGQAIGVLSPQTPPPLERLIKNPVQSSPMYADLLFTDRDIGGGPTTWRVHFAPIQEAKWTQSIQIHQTTNSIAQDLSAQTIWSYDPNRRLRGHILISTQNIPLLTEEINPQTGKHIFHFNIDRRSPFFQTPDWPILLGNLIEKRQQYTTGFSQHSLLMGETLLGRGLENGTWTIRSPTTDHTIEVSNSILSFTPNEFGTYTISNPDQIPVHRFVVNLTSIGESLLGNDTTKTTPSSIQPEQIQTGSGRWRIWIWLLILGLITWNWRINQ